MSDYSAVAPPQNFSQSSAFAAALERAKQIAAKINPQGAQNNSDPTKKRPLEDGSEPDAKKIAAGVTDPLAALRGNSIGDSSVIGRSSDTGNSDSGGLISSVAGNRDAVNRAKEIAMSLVSQRNKEDLIPGANPPYPGSGNSPSTAVQSILQGHPGYSEIMIPGPKVGLIIGKGGETIKQLQDRSGAKMVIVQDGPNQENEKPLRITGDPQKVEHAKQLVYELIAEKEMQAYSKNSKPGLGSGGDGGGRGGGMMNNQDEEIEVFVPKISVGLVIGKGGEMIRRLQEETGAKMRFLQGKDESPGDRTCIITGPHECVENARDRVNTLISQSGDKPKGSRGNGFGGRDEYGGWDRGRVDMTGKIEFQYPVPSNRCGIIIGKGGETIRQINQTTGAHCELDRRNPNNTDNDKYFLIRGTPDQVEHAKRIFGEKLGTNVGTNSSWGQNMGYNTSWNSTPGYQGWPGQQGGDGSQGSVSINPSTGQPDYSSQWAEYYRSMGMHREAEMIEQQAKQQGAGKPDMNQQNPQQNAVPAPQQPQQPQANQAQQNGGAADYSAQWAEYYRSIGKIKEAEAIEAQMKSGKATNQAGQSMPGAAPGAPAAFPGYGGYPGMNPAAPAGGYYNPSGQPAAPGAQSTPGFPAYQNYQYSQPSADN
ncbi:hypothetical protein QAD02_003943 [Eretmocerus hayati]|uniref:Uncharacterized protein n=1 Tax=Eretmocerus hayati TaxID=131215 RepID=A0ACC2NND9_9HYME|nr:hypothetical protein QAD02_003943 [Eretmocerus hayati]